MQGEVLKGHLELLLLAALRDEPAHGYRVVELLKQRSDGLFELGEGTIYPALYRLQRGGVRAREGGRSSRRRRRVYRLTPGGESALARKRTDWERFTTAMRSVVA